MKNEHNAINLLIPVSLEEQKELVSIKEQFISKIMQITDKKTYAHNLIPQIMKKLYPSTENTKELYEQLSDLKKCLDSFRPFNLDQIKYLQEVFDTQYTYASNRIEGNTLTLQETSFVINEGLTIEGKPFKDFVDAKNHAEAIDFLYDIIKDRRDITESLIKEMNALILFGIKHTIARTQYGELVKKKAHPGQYKIQSNHVEQADGTLHQYVDPLQVPVQMAELIAWLQQQAHQYHPIAVASFLHYHLVRIHPFDDGNGRGARLLMNLFLIKKEFFPVVIKNERKRYYLEALKQADDGDITHFIQFIIHELISTQEQVIFDLNSLTKNN